MGGDSRFFSMRIVPKDFSFKPTLLANLLALGVMWGVSGTIGADGQFYMLTYLLIVLLLGNEAWGHGVVVPGFMGAKGADAAAEDARMRRLRMWTAPLMFTAPFLMSGLLWLILNALDNFGVDYPLLLDDFVGDYWPSMAGLGVLWLCSFFMPMAPISMFVLLDTEDSEK